MYEKADIMRVLIAIADELDLNFINMAMFELANPGGTLDNAKFHTGQRSGAQIFAQTLVAKLELNGEEQ